MCVEEDERRRRKVRLDFKKRNCRNCGAPEAGTKCPYCDTWFVDPDELKNIILLYADDRVVEMIEVNAETEGEGWR